MEDHEDGSKGSKFVFRLAGMKYGSILRIQSSFVLKNPRLQLSNLSVMNK